MFESNPHGPSELSIRLQAFFVEDGSCSISNLFLIIKNFTNWRPLIWDLAMCMTVFRVINIGIDATFKDVAVRARLGSCTAGCSCQMYVQECGNVAQIEETTVPKLDGLRQ